MTCAALTTVGAMTPAQFARGLHDGLGVRFGPFDMHLQLRMPGLADSLHALYRDYPVIDANRVFTCHLTMQRTRSLRPGRPAMVRVLVDGRPPHEDMLASHALAVLEWGLNLAIVMRHQGYLMLHSAVLERDGFALLLPASPGHGKTTLCTALAHRGWRLLSDEFGLLRPRTRLLLPVPRPMPLKNESIAVIRQFAPEAVIGPEIPGTRKGTVAHVRPPADAVKRATEGALARWLVFPRWVAGSPLQLEPIPQAQAFMELAMNAFNYELLGLDAFETVRGIVDQADCYRLRYSNLDEAIAAMSMLSQCSAA